MLTGHHLRRAYGPRVVAIDIVASANEVNLHTLAGSPGTAVDIVCTVYPGVIIGCPTYLGYSFRTGAGWAVGSRLFLTNLGWILGRGGGGNSGDGGDAVYVEYNLTADNGSGLIGGGGGGGAKGVAAGDPLGNINGGGGGGGGGGQGSPGGAAGGRDTNYAVLGADGTAGSTTSAGGGGGGGDNGAYGNIGGAGGAGGELGANGGESSPNSASIVNSTVGAAGRAVRLVSGKTITFTAGNDAAHLRGAIL